MYLLEIRCELNNLVLKVSEAPNLVFLKLALPKHKQTSVVENGATQDTFLKSQGKLFLSFPCTLFLHIFDI